MQKAIVFECPFTQMLNEYLEEGWTVVMIAPMVPHVGSLRPTCLVIIENNKEEK